MIFIAIALGFISENIREDIVEKKMTNEFSLSMIEDLKARATVFLPLITIMRSSLLILFAQITM